MQTSRTALAALALAAALAACTAPAVPPHPAKPDGVASRDAERLRAIALDRSKERPAETYLVGPGDLLEVNVFDLAEMNRKVRVAATGYVQLPLIGAIKAAGRSEQELSDDIAKRLSRNYLQDPQVDVFVIEYKSQQVAVTGSVAKPGLYPLTRERYSILDMLSEAGGLTKDAGGMIQFIPAVQGKPSAAFEVASTGGGLPLGLGAEDDGLGPAPAADAIAIDLNQLIRGGNRAALNVGVAAGDVIYVPEAGSFTIEGWIDKPGVYALTRNTTALAAISAAGGPLFPARLGQVEVLRNRDDVASGREVIAVDLDEVRAGTAADVPLRAGDVVRVPAWKMLLPPWAFYAVLRDLIRIGASVPVI